MSGVLNNIQSDKQLYAVFNSTLRTYTVYFYNESTLLQTVNNVPYGGTANYTGSEPTKEGYEFSGWSPSNTNITGQTSCYAQFSLATLEVVEIEDSWSEIIAACNNGTYTKYHVGNYKPLTIGSETINMQIAGVNKDDLASGNGKAPLTWIAKEPLATDKRWNVAVVNRYIYPTVDAFTASGNVWTSQNRYYISTATATWTLTATGAGTINVAYKTSNSNASRNTITSLTVNGTEVVSNYANTTGGTYSVEVAAGDTVTVSVAYDLKSATYSYYATITFSGAAFTTSANVGTTTTRQADTPPYEDGTGAVGGWEAAELREYLRTTVFQSMPAEIQAAIKPVTKNQQSIDTSNNYVAQTTTETVWLPSYHEMGYGNLTGETASMIKYNVLFRDNTSRIKYKVGASSATYWWLRSAYNYSNAYYVYTNGNYDYNYTTFTFGVVPSFCT